MPALSRRNFACMHALVLLIPFAAAADPGKRAITAQDLWAVKRVGAPALSPDGKHAVVSVQEWLIDRNTSTASLWLVEVSSGALRRLTNSGGNDGSATWSHDGTRIAFTSNRGPNGVPALYVIPVKGGDAERLLELPYGVANPRWLPGDAALVIATRVIPELAGSLDAPALAAMAKESARRKASKMTGIATEVQQYRWFDRNLTDNLANRLLRFDLASKALTDLTPGYPRLFLHSGEVRFDVSIDGASVALVMDSAPPPFATASNFDVYLFPADGSGQHRNLTSANAGNDDLPRFSPDGQSLFYVRQTLPIAPYSGESRRLWRYTLADGRTAPVTRDIDLSIDDFAFSDNGRTLWLQAEDRGKVPVFEVGSDGRGIRKAVADGSNTELDSASGQLVFLGEDNHRAPELFALDARSRSPRRLTGFNDALFARLDLGKVESHEFPGAGGAKVQMWLTYPPGYDPGKKYPLVQLLHGGPHTMVRDAFGYRWNHHVFASPGYIVGWVNRHGSTGFGEAFARSIDGAWGDKPMQDILAANAYLFEKVPAIDRERVAAAGASYGGYLATWMLGHTQAFKTLVNHAGVSDFIGQYGSDITTGLFSREVMGGLPWDNPEGLQRNNPIAYAKHFKTPMLITHGEKDYRVPYGQGLALYGILQNMGVPSRLVIFPDENHWILSPQNSVYWNYEVQTWLARYIGGSPMAKPEFDPAP